MKIRGRYTAGPLLLQSKQAIPTPRGLKQQPFIQLTIVRVIHLGYAGLTAWLFWSRLDSFMILQTVQIIQVVLLCRRGTLSTR